jgi:MFS transporter, PPP family, 3-phenylpropionic acid transporter
MMKNLRNQIHPGLRGAFFYAAYWGAIGLFEPFIYVYFKQTGLSGAQIGWMAAVLPLCTLLINPLMARLADRTGRRVLILAISCAGFGAGITLLGLPGIQPTFIFLLAVVGLYSAFRSPTVSLADSLIAGMTVRHMLDFGRMRLWGSIVFTITAVSLGAVWQQTGYQIMFLFAGLAFLPVVASAMLLEEAPRPGEETNKKEIQNRPVDPGVVFLLGGTFFIIAALFMALTFGAIYMTELGGSAVMVGAMMGLSAFGEVPAMLFGSRIARRLGDTNTLLTAYILAAIGLGGYAFTSTPWVLLIFSALRGLGFGLLLVCTVMIINNRAPKGLSSTYQGILNAACWGLAPLIGGPVSGWVYQTYGPQTLFIMAAVMALAAALLITPTYRLWKEQKEEAALSIS